MADERKTDVSDSGMPRCAQCGVVACDAEPGTKMLPSFCPMLVEPELLDEVEKSYFENADVRQMSLEAARTEAAGYCKATRVEETMDFARRMGWRRLGIAHCVGLMKEAAIAREIFAAGGFEVYTVCCKTGSIDKESVGIEDEEKVHPGQREVLCNPVAQAALLAQAGTQFNVVIGLCVGHDSLFFMHSKAPATVLVAKDRVLGHNPVAALYTSRTSYRRLTKPAPRQAAE
jgi:uncharacterized metal-binding protein